MYESPPSQTSNSNPAAVGNARAFLVIRCSRALPVHAPLSERDGRPGESRVAGELHREQRPKMSSVLISSSTNLKSNLLYVPGVRQSDKPSKTSSRARTHPRRTAANETPAKGPKKSPGGARGSGRRSFWPEVCLSCVGLEFRVLSRVRSIDPFGTSARNSVSQFACLFVIQKHACGDTWADWWEA